MKIERNSKYLTISAYAVGTIIVSAIAVMIIFNIDTVMQKLSVFGAVANPIIIGIFCAYLINPLMTWVENKFFGKWSGADDIRLRNRARALSLTITMLAVVLILTLVVVMVIPQLTENIVAIFSNMDSYIATVKDFINKFFEDYPDIVEFLGNPIDDFTKLVTDIWNQYSNELLGFAGNLATGIWAVLDTMKNVIIGLIISIYLLAKKEMFVGQMKKVIFSFFKVKTTQHFLSVCKEANKKFLGSIVGKILEALLVAMICFVGCTIMNMPFALLIAVIMFVFNLIPFIGPAIGCIPCALLLLLSDDPIKALWFLIFMLILQNVDGNIIAPWILGDSTGLPAVWILISILIGGGLFGMLGMLLGVPVCAVIYMLVKDFIEDRLERRQLPRNTADYVGDVTFITPDYVHIEPEKPEPAPTTSKPTLKETISTKISCLKGCKKNNSNSKK